MKKFLLIISVLFYTGILAAQENRKTNVTDAHDRYANTVNLSDQVDRLKKPNGAALVHEQAGKFKLYASYKNSRVSGYYAITKKGNRINATYPAAAALNCKVCIYDLETKQQVCYQVDCDKIPPPKATVASRQ